MRITRAEARYCYTYDLDDSSSPELLDLAPTRARVRSKDARQIYRAQTPQKVEIAPKTTSKRVWSIWTRESRPFCSGGSGGRGIPEIGLEWPEA